MIVCFIDVVCFVGKCLGFGEGFFCGTTECYCTMAMGGEEFGDLREPCRTFRNPEAFFDALKKTTKN